MNVSYHKQSVEREQHVLSPPISVNDRIHIRSVMMADPLIHQHGQLLNVLLTLH